MWLTLQEWHVSNGYRASIHPFREFGMRRAPCAGTEAGLERNNLNKHADSIDALNEKWVYN
jgi:hypothetical protein